MTVLGEAIDESDDTRGARERVAPLLEPEIGRDDQPAINTGPSRATRPSIDLRIFATLLRWRNRPPPPTIRAHHGDLLPSAFVAGATFVGAKRNDAAPPRQRPDVDPNPVTGPAAAERLCSGDSVVLAILDAELPLGVAVQQAYVEKEAALRDAFASLSAGERMQLHRRLTAKAAGDALAERFARLAGDRRRRLLAVLARGTVDRGW